MSQHPSWQTLHSFVSGLLNEEECNDTAKHLDDCITCLVNLESIQVTGDVLLESLKNSTQSILVSAEWDLVASQLGDRQIDFQGPKDEQSRDLIGRNIAEYTIGEPIGKGGMGCVYKAHHRVMDRVVAIKVISDETAKRPNARARFLQEVKAIAKLQHPNIVAGYDAGIHENVPYLITEYIDGSNLSDLLKLGSFSLEDALDALQQSARGLGHVHSKGLVHRDIKPSNLIRDADGVIRILDLGLASIANDSDEADSRLTQSQQLFGTIDFMAPEQAVHFKEAGPKSDVYSLGCTLYFLLTGRAPYQGDSAMKKLLAHRDCEIPSIRSVRPDVPEELDSLFRTMLAKQPDQRPSMAEVENFAARIRSGVETCVDSIGIQRPAAYELVASQTGNAMVMPNQDRSPPRWNGFIALAAAAGVVGVLAASILFLQTEAGTIRIEILDPETKVQIVGSSVTLKQGDEPEVKLKAGEQVLRVERGDLTFDTRSFTLKNKDRKTVIVSLVDGALLTTVDGEKLGSRPVTELSGSNNLTTTLVPLAIQGPLALRMGSNGKIVVPTLHDLPDPQGDFTMELWFLLEVEKTTTRNKLLEFDDTIELRISTGDNLIYWTGTFEEIEMVVHGVVAAKKGIPTHVALVRERDKMRLFVNGQLASESTLVKESLSPSRKSFEIGNRLEGQVGAVRVSSKARYRDSFSPTIRWDSDEQTLLLLNWEEGAGSKASDSSRFSHVGVLEDSTWLRPRQ